MTPSLRPEANLAVVHPEIAAEADGWDPTTVTPGSNKRMSWLCAHHHTWRAVVANRARGQGCPICSGQQVLQGFNDLATTNPEVADQADGWDPSTVTAGSNQKKAWRCTQNHGWTAAVANRVRGTGCPYCAGIRTWPGFNDLATTNPDLAAQADGWDPTTIGSGSNHKVSWLCPEHGHSWIAAVANRSRGVGCPYCSGQRVWPGFNDLATTNPDLAAQADGWDPTTVSAGSGKKLSWRCSAQGHTWDAKVTNRSRGSGCPRCADRSRKA